MKQSQIILIYNASSIVEASDNINNNVTFQSLSNDRLQHIHFMSENKTIVSLQPL